MLTEETARTNNIEGAYLRESRLGDRSRPRRTHMRSFHEVAFVPAGRGEHRRAARDLAIAFTEKSQITLTPLNGVTEKVWSGRYDLVIAGSEEPWSMRDLLRWNMERRLVRYCPSAVAIVKHRPVSPSKRVVVAIDPDSMDRKRTVLASETIRAALAFPTWDDYELHVVNVIPSFPYYVLGLNGGASLDQAKDWEFGTPLQQRQSVYNFLEGMDVDLDRVIMHLLQGDPVRTIANLVSHLDADWLTIGSFARRGIGRLLRGNTAEKVIRQVSCSYLVIK